MKKISQEDLYTVHKMKDIDKLKMLKQIIMDIRNLVKGDTDTAYILDYLYKELLEYLVHSDWRN